MTNKIIITILLIGIQFSMNIQNKTETAIFAGGCFWCTEAIFNEMNGVESVESGYIGGKRKNPTYEQVSSGATGHAEAVRIKFNPEIVTYEELLQVFFATHNPTQLNRQGNDVGSQYRSAIFYTTLQQKELAKSYILFLEEEDIYDAYIETVVVKATDFYVAEAYHQNYLKNNPENSYCQYVILPKIQKFRKLYKHKLKNE